MPEPDVITGSFTSDMTHSDLVKALEHLPRRDDFYIIRLDRDVRDYLADPQAAMKRTPTYIAAKQTRILRKPHGRFRRVREIPVTHGFWSS